MELRATFGATHRRAATPQRVRRPRDRTSHDPPRALVLAGGLSHERDVSLRSGRRAAEALRDAGVEVVERDVDGGLLRGPEGRAARVRRPDAARRERRGRRDPRGARPARASRTSAPGRPPAAPPSTSRSPSPWSPGSGITTPESVCLPHETFRELGAADRDGGRRRPAGAAAHRQAGQERLGAGLLARADRRGAPRRDGERLRLRPGGAHRALRGRHGGGRAGDRRRQRPPRAARGRRSSRTAASTTTPRATPPAPPSSRYPRRCPPPRWPSAPGSRWPPTRRSGCATSRAPT